MAKKINVGLIGYKFMGKAHSNAFARAPFFFPDMKATPVMKTLVGRDRAGVKKAAAVFGWQEFATDWREVVSRDDIDLIDVSTPGHSHAEIAIAAAEHGKHVICEKPLANSLDEAVAMLKAVRKARVRHMVSFNYRRVPAVQLARSIIDSGRLGKIRHFRAVYLQDWITDPEFPLVWRLRKELSGSGAHGDLNAHIVDLARFLVGEIGEVTGMTETFIKERPLPAEQTGLRARKSKKMGKVTVDDCALFLARFKDGAVGSFEATRFAAGRKNYNHFEINGEGGSLAFNFERMNELEFFDASQPPELQGWNTILATEPCHAYCDAWWPPGHPIGYEHPFVHQVYDMMNAIADNKPARPDFLDGARCQAVLDAVMDSAASGRWVKVKFVR